MSFLLNVSIRSRFYIVLVSVSLSLCVLGIWGWVSGAHASRNTAELFIRSNTAAADISMLRESLSLVRRWESSALAVGTSNATQVQTLIKAWKAEIARAHQAAEQIVLANPGNAEIATLVATQTRLMRDYVVVMEPTLDQLQMAVIDGLSALAYSAKTENTLKALGENTAQLTSAQQNAAESAREEMATQSTSASLLRLGLIALTLLIFAPLMWWTLRAVCQPLDRAVALARQIADGDLSQTIVVRGEDEMAQLLLALDAMQSALRQVVGEVRDASESIKLASAEVASGNLDLSQRTEQTASKLQSTASSLSELTGAVWQSAQSAKQAHHIASSAADVAVLGGRAVSEVVGTMHAITQSSGKIADIISVIDVIAFQTNILALNAAVEAARAGEQGRGFAVVASEVRNLATRSAQAAKEIKTLIDSSVHRVQEGSQLASSAGETMQDIVASAQRVTSTVAAITETAVAQSQSIEQVNGTVAELDQMTQQNAALVEQSAAAAQALQDQAEKLVRVVGTFRLVPVPIPHQQHSLLH
ncbi:HAMP domain-containing protein [Rhodoferax sp. AJA081-3]|uniref:methyl-accepting chemotaxis protein n=1 Tax=Rhodoferax sp. AJA081-3 TaxID=2752316 RepID=UPI001AE0E3ED|nr:methyl-accepting chemotaxis protein [Rhodoferax sp. AJA081-3]QTN26713.1 HAMP domain-containing protein [Rhodoferax sp. AJA081-3]